MTSEPLNVLIAVFCLITLVLAGGFTQAVVPRDANLRFAIDGGSGWCPENRNVRGCVPRNMSGDFWQVQLIEPFLEDLLVDNDSTSSSGSTEPSTGTPTSGSTPTNTGTTSVGSPSATPTAGQGRSTTPTTAPTAPTEPGGGFNLDAGVDWLIWPLLAVIGTIGTIGVVVALRRGPIETPRDLLRVPARSKGFLLGLLVAMSSRAAVRLQAFWSAVIGPLVRATSWGPTPPETSAGAFQDIRGLFRRLALLPGFIVERVRGLNASGGTTESSPRQASKLEQPPDPTAETFDIRRAWAWLARQAPDRRAKTRTPGDIAADAIARGYPREAVYELLASFRDVTYGDIPPTDSRIQAARRAYETLRDADRSSPGGDDA